MHPVYHAKITVSTKNFPRSEGRKCGVKGLVRRGLMVWSRSIACSGAFDEIALRLIPSLACSGAFDETALRLIPSFPLGNGLWWSRSWFFHRATGFPYISYILPCRLNSFTRRAYGQGNGRKRD